MGEQVKRAIIVGAAAGDPVSFLPTLRRAGDCLICADGGRRKLDALGIRPDWYVGDNDSGGTPDGLPATLLPSEKDVSDLEMAIDQAFAMGCREIILIGCSGGRADHYLANVHLLEQIHDRGGEGRLMDAANEIRFLSPGSYQIANDPVYHYFGLIPLDRELTGVTLKGAKYPLQDHTLLRGSTRSISNEMLPGAILSLTIGSGAALLIRSQPE